MRETFTASNGTQFRYREDLSGETLARLSEAEEPFEVDVTRLAGFLEDRVQGGVIPLPEPGSARVSDEAWREFAADLLRVAMRYAVGGMDDDAILGLRLDLPENS